MKKTVFSQFTLITSVVFLLLVTACSSPSGSSSSPKTNSEPVEPKRLDAVCCSNDSTAQGVTGALLEAGFTAANFPLITGQDCDITSVYNMIAGTQSMSVFKYTNDLSDQAIKMADAAFKGTSVDTNDSTYNDPIYVPTYKVEPRVVTKDNYEQWLINTGFYVKNSNETLSFHQDTLTVSNPTSVPEGTKIGIVMPYPLLRWKEDGIRIKDGLRTKGYADDEIYLSFATSGDNSRAYNDQISLQKNAITALIANSSCKVIVIAPVDGYSLTQELANAKSKGIKIISYDRLIMESDAVSYYVTFDNYKVGTLQGQYLVDKLNLASRTSSNPANIEFFTGDIRDNNINFFFGGAMDILKPYLDSGVLVCPSGQKTKEKAATEDWSTENAKQRMKTLISSCKYSPDL